MPSQVLMPQLGESVIEGTISKWLVTEGSKVNEFDPLVEVNTDKVDTEIPSPTSGIVLKILVAEDEVVEVGTNLAWIGKPGDEIPDKPLAITEPAIEVSAGDEQAIEIKSLVDSSHTATSPGRDQNLGFISPVVAKIASEQSVDLTLVNGTGQGGRITKKDILMYLESREKIPSDKYLSIPDEATVLQTAIPAKEFAEPDLKDSLQPNSTPQLSEVVSLTPVRRAIAEHMVHSKQTSPHVTTVMEANMGKVVTHREQNKATFANNNVKLTFTAYFIAASIIALKAYPIVNSSWSDAGIILHREINIGMATSMGESGLIVPVIKNSDTLSLLGIARTVNDLADRARSKQLNPDEVQGGTFTITNHGISGSLFATPIINQPQCSILGVGAIQKRVVVIEDAIAIRPMVYLSLTFDHRILDGAVADHYLSKVVESLENWSD
jgi:2-oxoglutarate dehydrogenase E2 component (dihydrolipoamide succinyltransferase)